MAASIRTASLAHYIKGNTIPNLSSFPLIDILSNPWHIWDYGPFYGDGNSSGIPAGISSIQRRWYFWPIYDIYSGNMTCNFDGAATNNSLHASVMAGSTIVAQYNALNFTLTTVDKTIVNNLSLFPLFLYLFSQEQRIKSPFLGSRQ
jgi:hypothetical protein